MAQNWNRGGYNNNMNRGGYNNTMNQRFNNNQQYNNNQNMNHQYNNNMNRGYNNTNMNRGGYNNVNHGGYNNRNRGAYNNNNNNNNNNHNSYQMNRTGPPPNHTNNNNNNPNNMNRTTPHHNWNNKSEQQQLKPQKRDMSPKPQKKPNSTREYDHLFKLVLIGDATVGKTSLLLRFADDSFKDNYISTIGVDFRFRTLTINGELVKLQIWDTAGQERFRTITSAYYRGTDGIIMVYDITNISTFDHVQDWLNEVHKVTGSSITKLIIGNKNDLQHKRQVNSHQAQQFALSVSASIIETSAKTANNVDKSFTMIAEELVKRGKVQRKSIVIRNADDDDDEDTKKKCCF